PTRRSSDLMDGIKNGLETDVDCGGPACMKCGGGHACLVNGDCGSNLCSGGVCTAFLQFRPLTNYLASNAVYGLTVADMNGDGKKDIVATSDGSPPGLHLLEGFGDGTFT